jgi:putative transposase
MPRSARVAPGGQIYHVLNRSAGKRRLFDNDADFEAFERIMIEAHQRHPIRILSYAFLPDHWHFVVWPRKDGQLADFFRWLAHTHAMRRKRTHRKTGHGRLYQGRYKSFLVQRDENLLTVLRYVERTPVAAGLVEKAQLWRFGSLCSRTHGDPAIKSLLAAWPVERTSN